MLSPVKPRAQSEVPETKTAVSDTLVIQRLPFIISMLVALAVMTVGGLIQVRRNQELVETNARLTSDMAKVHGRVSEMEQVLEQVQALTERLEPANRSASQAAPATESKKVEADDTNDTNDTSASVNPEIDLLDRLNHLLIDSHVAAYRLESLAGAMQRRQQLLATIPSRMPVRGIVSSGYGMRRSPFNDRLIQHKGIDLAAPKGTPVFASADGEVIFSGRSRAYGNTVVIAHGYGIVTKYAHNSKLYAKIGDRVTKGEMISRVGSTGRSTGAHLHYEVWVNGKTVSPRRFFVEQPSYANLVARAVSTEESTLPVLASLGQPGFRDSNVLDDGILQTSLAALTDTARTQLAIGGESEDSVGELGDSGEISLEIAGSQVADAAVSADGPAVNIDLSTAANSARYSNAAYGAGTTQSHSTAQQNRALLVTLATFLLCCGVFWAVARRIA